MSALTLDIAHLLAGSLVLVSFLLLYQDRLYALLNVYALHALVLALSVAWQAYAQDAPQLYITAAIALLFKAIVIPVALHRMIVRLGIQREIETVGGIGLTVLVGVGLVAMAALGKHTLVLTTSTTAVEQWRREILDKTDLTEDQVATYTGDSKAIEARGPLTAGEVAEKLRIPVGHARRVTG